MSTFTQQQIDEQYKKLPAELQTALFSPDTAKKVFEVGRKYLLTVEKTGFLAEEIGFMILGLVKTGDFLGNIKSRLELDEDEAKEIADEVNQQIFFPLREALKNAYQMEIVEETSRRGPNKKPAEPLSLGNLGGAKPSFAKLSAEIKEELEKELPKIEKLESSVKPEPSRVPPIVLEKKPAVPAPAPAPKANVQQSNRPPFAPIIPRPARETPAATQRQVLPPPPAKVLEAEIFPERKTFTASPIVPRPPALTASEEKTPFTKEVDKKPAENKTKIPPIDLRKIREVRDRPEMIRGVIFSVPKAETSKETSTDKPHLSDKPVPTPMPPSPPPTSRPTKVDPYRETVD